MPKIRVLVDGYYLGKPSGYGRFVGELLRAIGTSEGPFDIIVAVPDSTDAKYLVSYPEVTYIPLPPKLYPLWEQISIPAAARAHKCKIIHSLYNTRPILAGSATVVTTVHDLTFLASHAGRDLKSSAIHLYMAAAFRFGTLRSKQIISVSDTTKRALQDRGIKSTRIYNSVDGFIQTPADSGASPERPYFLHRGSYAVGHRNTDRIIAAFQSRPQLTAKYDLKLLGVPDGQNVWKTHDDPTVQYLPYLTDRELATLYAQSTAVVAVSLLEGFCLPIVEAFGFNTPVITSDLDPMREIGGAAAMIVDPNDIDAIADAMVRVGSDETVRNRMIESGKARLHEFSSEALTQQLFAIYHASIASPADGSSGARQAGRADL